MKQLIVLLIFLFHSIFSFTQEIEHKHSVFHALVENKGQWDSKILFQSKSQKHTIWAQQHGFIYDIRDFSKLQAAHAFSNMDSTSVTDYKSTVVASHFIGSNEVSIIEKKQPTQHYYNYFIGNDKTKWQSDVHGFQEVLLKNFYEGVDLKILDDEQQFKYELWCHQGSDPKSIKIEWKNAKGLKIDQRGNLVITTELGEIIEQKPIAFALHNGKVISVSCSFELDGNNVKFKLGSYPKSATLVIDPTLVFATYCGSVTDNFGMTATYGYDGTAYSAGTIYGNAYPTPDNLAYDVTSNFTVANIVNPITTDAFISKYSPDGTTMIWTTFLGGGDNTQGTETSHSLICDKQNNIYIYGVTSSLDFPIVNGFQASHAGGTPLRIDFNGSNFGSTGTDIFVSKFSSNGHNLLGSTYIGGSLNDGVNYKISSGNYNTVVAYDSLTTNYGDQFRGEIMIDSIGNCLVASCSRSLDFPLNTPFQATNNGQQDGVIFKLNSDLSTLMWSSYFGGTNNDACYSVKIDSSYNIVFAGGTSSTNIPGTSGAHNPTYQGGKADGFVGKLSSNGQTLTQSTYIGTPLYDQTFFVEVDRLDNIFIFGQSVGGTYPIINATGNLNSGQYITKFDPTLTTVLNSTTFGNENGNFNISPSAFLVDICGNMYVSGWGANLLQSTPLSGMPVSSNAFQQNPANGFDFYLAVFDRDFDGLLYGSYLGGNQAQEHVDGGTSRFDKNGVVYQSVCGGCGGHSDFPTTQGAWSQSNLSDNCNNLVFKFDFELIPSAEFTTDNILGCAPFEVTLFNSSPPSDSYLWDFGNGDTTSIIYSPTVTYPEAGEYTVLLYVTDSICLLTDTAQTVVVVYPELLNAIPFDTVFCIPSPLPLTFTANSFGTATQFLWSSDLTFSDTLNTFPLDSIISVSPDLTSTYYLKISNPGCSKIDSVVVYIVEGSLELSGSDSLCPNVSTTLSASINIPGISFSLVWSPDSIIQTGKNTNQVTVNPFVSQWVYCEANGSNGCNDKDSMYINVGILSSSVSAIAVPTSVVPGKTTELSAFPLGFEYTWTPSTGVSFPNSQTTSATVNETTDFTVEISDGICTKQANVQVKVLSIVCDRTYVYVPNAFSPNGDGENDVLRVRSEITTEILFRVYDRWGEMIFESTDINSGWDGKLKGKLVDPDTYDYYLEATCINGEQEIIKGNVTLIR